MFSRLARAITVWTYFCQLYKREQGEQRNTCYATSSVHKWYMSLRRSCLLSSSKQPPSSGVLQFTAPERQISYFKAIINIFHVNTYSIIDTAHL
jgi:hypothetical protein